TLTCGHEQLADGQTFDVDLLCGFERCQGVAAPVEISQKTSDEEVRGHFGYEHTRLLQPDETLLVVPQEAQQQPGNPPDDAVGYREFEDAVELPPHACRLAVVIVNQGLGEMSESAGGV